MIFKRFSITIVFQVILMTIFIFLGFWSLSQNYLLFTKYGFFGFALIQLCYIIYLVNRHNRDISSFLENFVINETFPRLKKTYNEKSFIELEKHLNRIAESYGKVKVQNEEQHQMLQLLIDHIEIAIVAYDSKNNIIIKNKYARLLFGKEIMNLVDLDTLKSDLSKIIGDLKPGNPEVIRIKKHDFIRPYSFKISHFVLNNKELKLLSISEIEKELAKEDLNSLQTLIKILRHEIINSITPITTLTDSMLHKFEETELDEGNQQNLLMLSGKSFRAINKRSDGLLEFVDRVKVISAIPEPIKENVKIVDLVNNILPLFGEEIDSRKIELKVMINPIDIVINADEKLISQVFINLVKNAIQAIENTGKPIIEVESQVDSAGKKLISISDNGTGIPEDLIDKIFVPFFTTRKDGSGIGLSFARQVMIKHGGFLSLEQGGGRTIFIMSF